nr:hypothetical protein CFP56_33940 [Quercus suber]
MALKRAEENGAVNFDENFACFVHHKKLGESSDQNDAQFLMTISILFTFLLFLSTTVAECLQSPSMLCPNPLQFLAPTHQPQSYQNRAYQSMKTNPLRGTLRKDPLCSTNAQVHLLSAWDIVAATVGLCI